MNVKLEDLPFAEVARQLRDATRAGSLDEHISAGARVALRALSPADAARWASALEPLRTRLEKEHAVDAWQTRTWQLSLAQLYGRAGAHEASARAWFRFGAIAPHRAREADEAGLTALRAAGLIDEWLELACDRRLTPNIATRLASADALERRVLLEALPLLERWLEEPVSADVLAVTGVTSSLLEQLIKEGFAPEAAAFHAAFGDEWDLHTRFDGVLALPPARPCGFFVSTVDFEGKRRAAAVQLLESARSSKVVGSSLRATWNTPHTTARASKMKAPPPPPKRARTFGAAVKTLVRRKGREEVTRFSALPHADLTRAVAEFEPSWLAKGHNSAPTIAALLAATRAHAAKTTFSGGVVWPPRADRRLYVDGVSTPATAKTSGWKKTADEYERDGKLVHVWWD